MTPNNFLSTALDPGLRYCTKITGLVAKPEARLLLMSIAGQESGWKARMQVGGPAHSYFQAEQGGAVHGVMLANVVAAEFRAVCDSLDIPFTEEAVYEAITWNDLLAVSLARLLVYTDPPALPTNQDDAWACYSRLWRPGKPDRTRWSTCYPLAASLCTATPYQP